MRDPSACVYLHPGDWVVSAERLSVRTILGPCVAVALWDPSTGAGGMNHVVLPHRLGAGQSLTQLAGPGTRQLLEQLLAAGAKPSNLRARVFGGACIGAAMLGRASGLGEQNVCVVREVLAAAAVPVLSEDVGGTHGRKVTFCTATGASQVTLL